MTGDGGEVQRWREQLAALPAGPALAAAIAAPPAGVVEPAAEAAQNGDLLSDAQRAAALLDRIVARRRLLSTWLAQEIGDVALLTAIYPFPLDDLPTELGQALTLTDGQAHRLLADADTYTHRLAATLDAWTTGQIPAHAAAAILDATATTTDHVAGRVEALVLPHAGSRTYDQTWASARRRVLRLDPDATRRHQIAATTRCVTRRALPDGMGRLTLTSTAAEVAAVWEAITGLADAAAPRPSASGRADDNLGDNLIDRDLGNKRADALVDVCTDILAKGGYHNTLIPRRNGRLPQVRVTMALGTLLGADNHPADLAGHGPITADEARLIAGDAELRRLICDPIDGTVIDYGRTVYRPPRHLADLVLARDDTCPFPGCRQPADRGQLDHIDKARPDPTTGKPTQGATNADNLAPPCTHHHQAKDHRGWTLRRTANGGYHLTSPLGRTTTRPPHTPGNPDGDDPAEDDLSANEIAVGEGPDESDPADGDDLPPPF